MAWRVEVIADSSGKRAGNGLVFETEAEARAAGENLMDRWTSVTEVFVVETDRAVTARYDATKPYPAALTHLATTE
jgi:hypothetical protein